MTILRFLHQLLAFSLEIGLLAALFNWGYQTGKKPFFNWLLAFAALSAAIFLWGWLAAPKSGSRLEQPWLLVFKLLIFGAGALGLVRTGQVTLAIWFFGLALCSVLAEYFWGM